jgi:hypothetical protein
MTQKMRFSQAKLLCRLDTTFEINSDESIAFALRVWKEQMVDARRAGDEDRQRLLSQAKQVFKARHTRFVNRMCPTCEQPKSYGAHQCRSCSTRERRYGHSLNEKRMKQNEIESDLILVPPRSNRTGALTACLRKLATEGTVGDSFVTNKANSSVQNVARSLGMDVIVRKLPPVPGADKKAPPFYRVWRSDGNNEQALNDILRRRRDGEKIVSPPCVPPKPSVPVDVGGGISFLPASGSKPGDGKTPK